MDLQCLLLLESIAAVPVLVLLTHRPGYPPPFGDQTYYSRITLHRLSDAQMRAMVERVLQSADVPTSVLELIARCAEGNPLFIEELCKALVEDGTLERAHLVEQQHALGQVQADEIRGKTQRGLVWMALALIVGTRLWLAGEVSPHRDLTLVRRLMARVHHCAAYRPLLFCVQLHATQNPLWP